MVFHPLYTEIQNAINTLLDFKDNLFKNEPDAQRALNYLIKKLKEKL